MRRTSKSSELVSTFAVLFVAAGCGSSAASFPTASALDDDAPRRPDGVAIDPESQPPDAEDVGHVDDGLVTLRAPLGVDAARDTVSELFRHVVNEDPAGIETLFTANAVAITTKGSRHQRTPTAALWWSQRFDRLDYGLLGGEPAFREREIQFFRGEDVLAGARGAPAERDGVERSDVVVRVPILKVRVGAIRLLGDEMVLFLRRVDNRYKIYRMVEEFSLP